MIIPALQALTISILPKAKVISNVELTESEIRHGIKKLEKACLSAENRLNRKTPYQPYLVVNSGENRFYLYSRRKLVREGRCSTGSYIMLKAADERKWIFKTPRGVFRIQGKITSPVWKKPDWAFIEEGLPVPAPDSYLRYEFGVLGDYAMSLGHGYLIHGTLYQRLLGMPVTHGCIRLGDDDLKIVYQYLNIGSKVFIY
jgi:lipoprotein-anchoring transpeptidase ErfK/SrfK